MSSSPPSSPDKPAVAAPARAADVLPRVRASLKEGVGRGGARKAAFHCMGTLCELTFHGVDTKAGNGFIRAAVDWVSAFEGRYSRFIPDSLIGQINRSAGSEWVQTDPETDQIFGLCQELFFLTRRAFDPTSMPLVQLWDWKRQPISIPGASEIARACELVGWDKVHRRAGGVFLPSPGMSIDLGGIGKEYAVDRVAQMAGSFGIQNVLVNFGQDVRAVGTAPGLPAWHVGLEDPKHPGQCWGGVAAKDVSVATSGDYLRRFELNGKRYGHIIDPRTGHPVDNGSRSVSVIAPVCTVAGVLSTTAFILGPQEGLEMIHSYPMAAGCISTDQQRYETRHFSPYLTR